MNPSPDEFDRVLKALNQVLAKQCKVVELVDTVPRRGSVEKIYRLRIEAASRLPAAVEPGSRQEVMWAMSLGESLLGVDGTPALEE